MRTNTESITSLWSGIPAVYEAPTADIVYAAMGPVSTEATTFADKADKVAAALTDFAANIATVKTERDTLRTDAQTFRDEIDGGVWLSLHETKKYEYLAVSASNSQSGSQAGSYQLASGAGMTQSQGLDYLRAQGETVKTSGGVIMILSDWKESSEHVDRNNQLLDRAADLYAKISGFEADCANTINAQRDSCVAEAVPVESWMLKQDAEGTVDLPWGQRSEEDRNCGESIWHGVGTGAKGFAEGLGSLLVGYNPQSGGWWDLNVWGPSLVALGTGFGGLILSTSGVAQIAGLFPGPFQTVMQKANAGSLDMLKGLVAWDEWSKNPGEAFGQTLFNAATIVVPGPKGLGGLLKGTTIGGKIHEFLNIGTKAADDVIAGARDLFRKPKFDHPKIDVPDFKDDIHTDRPGDGNPVHGHDGGGDSGGPVVAGAHETPRGHGGGGIHDGPDVRNDGSSGHDGGHAAGDERGPGGSSGNDWARNDGEGHEPLSNEDFSRLSTEQRLEIANAELSDGAITFADNTEAAHYGAEHWNDYADQLPDDQRRSLYEYTTDPPARPSYVDFNSVLRGQKAMTPELEKGIFAIDEALAGSPVTDALVVSRGTGYSHWTDDPTELIGEHLSESAYFSTSLGSAAFFDTPAVLHLRVPAGTPALYLGKISEFGETERELLLGRSIDYRVDRVVLGENGQWQIFAKVIAK